MFAIHPGLLVLKCDAVDGREVPSVDAQLELRDASGEWLPTAACVGINEASAVLLGGDGYTHAYQLLGLYLTLSRDNAAFVDILRNEGGCSENDARICATAMDAYAEMYAELDAACLPKPDFPTHAEKQRVVVRAAPRCQVRPSPTAITTYIGHRRRRVHRTGRGVPVLKNGRLGRGLSDGA